MSDSRYWSRDFLTEFIETYKKHTCLWKIKSKEYTNKNLKAKAYAELVAMCKKINENSDCKFVKKKIQALRGAYRKELKKVTTSKKSGSSQDDVYIPSLWYFDLLMFTKDQETPAPSETNLTDDEEPSTPLGPESVDEVTSEITVLDEGDDELSSEKQGPAVKKATKDFQSPKRKVSDRYLTSPQVTRFKTSRDERSAFMKACTDALNSNEDEYNAIGVTVAAKLKKMNQQQRLYADNLINQVLYKGLTNNLTENTAIFENCYNNYQYNYAPYGNLQPRSENSRLPGYINTSESSRASSAMSSTAAAVPTPQASPSLDIGNFLETFEP